MKNNKFVLWNSKAFKTEERRLFVLFNIIQILLKRGKIEVHASNEITLRDLDDFALLETPIDFNEEKALEMAAGIRMVG